MYCSSAEGQHFSPTPTHECSPSGIYTVKSFVIADCTHDVNILQICVHAHNHPVTDPPVDVLEKAIISPTPVTVDTILLVTAVDCVLVAYGQEMPQLVQTVSIYLQVSIYFPVQHYIGKQAHFCFYIGSVY